MMHRIWLWHIKFVPRTSWWCIFFKPIDRKLSSGKARWNWASRQQSVSWQEYSLCRKTKYASALEFGSMFSKGHYFGGWIRGKYDLMSLQSVWKKSLLQYRSRAQNLEFLSVFCTFVTNAKVKEPHEMPMIIFNLSDQFVFLLADLQLATVCSHSREANTRLVGTHIEDESSHRVITSKPNFQKVTCSECCSLQL